MTANVRKSAELNAALDAASVAGEISRRYYSGEFTVTTKSDRTPVTQADIECEQAIRQIISDAFPDDGFYGEETGQSNMESGRVWLVDPIDGTKAFVRNYPFFSTQIALMQDGEIVLGVSSSVLFDEVNFAERGAGAWNERGERLHVSDVGRLEDAALSTGNLKSLAGSDGWARFGEIVGELDRIRGYGDFYHYHLLSAGNIDAVVESDVNILDVAALSVIVAEAGGEFTDLNGNPASLETRSVLAANPLLHGELLDRLKGFVQ